MSNYPIADIRQRLHYDWMLTFAFVLICIIMGTSLIAGAVTAICRLVIKSNALSLAVGTLAIPVLICASLAYWIKTMDVDDPAPGNVLMGNLTVLAIVTPIALLSSYVTIKFMSGRALRNGS